MLQQLVNQFMSSPQGQTAFTRLGAQGFQPQQSQAFMSAAVPTAAQSLLQAQRGGMAAARPGGPQGVLDVGNSHYVTNFLSGAVSSLIRGQGVMGAAVDGVQGVAGGHVAQVIASRFGLPQRVAGTVGAILTPLVIDWLWEKVNGGGLDLGSLFGGGQAPGAVSPTMQGGLGAFLGGGQAPAAPPQQQGWGGGPAVSAAGPVSPTVQGGLGSLFNMFNR